MLHLSSKTQRLTRYYLPEYVKLDAQPEQILEIQLNQIMRYIIMRAPLQTHACREGIVLSTNPRGTQGTGRDVTSGATHPP